MRRFDFVAFSRSLVCCLGTVAAVASAVPASALVQSWNGYKWSRTGNLAIQLGNNLTGAWAPRLVPTATAWSAAKVIDFVPVAGSATSSACGPVYGTVQVCNSNYGANGWLGYASVWLSSSFIVQATVRLNDYYFGQAKYNTNAWRDMTICQEVGHTLGLAHVDTIKTNINLGTCMDYTNDPTGLLGTNGTLANVAPDATDISALNSNYATLNTTQLASTRPQSRAGAAFGVDGDFEQSLTAVPEPGTWALMLIGFGCMGAAVRRKSFYAVTA